MQNGPSIATPAEVHPFATWAPGEDDDSEDMGEPSLSKLHPARLMADYSCCAVLLGLGAVLAICIVGIVSLPLTIETNFNSFLVTDVEASIKLNAFENALESRAGYSQRRLGAVEVDLNTIYMSKDLLVTYELKGRGLSLPGGVFHSKAISSISKFEHSLRILPGWQSLCGRSVNSSRGLCETGMTLVRYMLPTMEFEGSRLVPSVVMMDGKGFEPVEVQTALELVSKQESLDLLLPEGFNDTLAISKEPTSRYLRSAFRFKVPCCSSEDSMASRRITTQAFTDEWELFFRKEVLPLIKEGPPLVMDEPFFNVWYEGSDIESIEVKTALSDDYILVILAMIFVHLYLLLHTQSIILGLLGPFIALISVPLTFVLCAVGLGATTVSFANFLALFLIVGFGADVILVYTDFWDESRHYHTKLAERLNWTYTRSIKTSITTTGTTALAFLANLASVIRALRQFGFFMGMCVCLAWIMVAIIYAPLMVVNHRCQRRTKRAWALLRPGGETGPGRFARMSAGWKHRFLVRWLRILYRFRRCIFISTVVLAVTALAVSVPQLEAGTDMPSIFPADHNQNAGKLVRDNFVSMSQVFGPNYVEPPDRETVCQEPSTTGVETCAVNWCEAQRAVELPPKQWPGNGSCNCFRRFQPRTACTEKTPYAYARERFIGPPSLESGQILIDVSGYLNRTAPPGLMLNAILATEIVKTQKVLATTLIQEWETGTVAIMRTCEVTAKLQRMDRVNAQCGWDDMCFCGSERVCKLDASTWAQQPSMQLISDPRRRLDMLTVFQVAVNKQSKVRAVFGLEIPTTVKLLGQNDPSETWEFQSTFDLRQPWSQRNIHNFCSNLTLDLRVARQWCWMSDFRQHVRDRKGRFPCRSEEFDAMAMDFTTNSASATRGTRYIWLLGGEVKALYISLEVDVNRNSGAAATLAYKAKWDEYLDKWNAGAYVTARGAHLVSQEWVKAEAESQLVMSTIQTLVILFILAFVAMFVFTQSICISLFVVIATLAVVCGLTFFMVVVNGWQVGLIEVISIIYFIGYALDYSLHIAYKYCSSEALQVERPEALPNLAAVIRYQRTAFSVKSMGGAVLGSAATTAGSSFFLCFCTLTLFNKLGAMCLAVTLLSVVIALCPLPAALMMFGPQHPGCHCCCCARRRAPPEKDSTKAAKVGRQDPGVSFLESAEEGVSSADGKQLVGDSPRRRVQQQPPQLWPQQQVDMDTLRLKTTKLPQVQSQARREWPFESGGIPPAYSPQARRDREAGSAAGGAKWSPPQGFGKPAPNLTEKVGRQTGELSVYGTNLASQLAPVGAAAQVGENPLQRLSNQHLCGCQGAFKIMLGSTFEGAARE